MRFCLILLLVMSLLLTYESKTLIRFTRIICEISRNTIPEQPTCFIKTHKKQSYFTIRFNLTRKTPNALLNYNSNRKNSDGYTRIVDLKNLEICKMIQSNKFSFTGIISLMFESSIKIIKGNAFEICTKKEGEKSIDNFTLSSLATLFEPMPAGEYLASHLLFDKNDENILNITLYYQLFKK